MLVSCSGAPQSPNNEGDSVVVMQTEMCVRVNCSGTSQSLDTDTDSVMIVQAAESREPVEPVILRPKHT
eukprot:533513-Pelagomonas_calceolata.AAC.1